MKWDERYATGIPAIDEQHRQIFRMTEDYAASLEEGGGEKTYPILLDFLDRYIRTHFAFEERCMEEYRCPAAASNRAAHSRFTEMIADYRKRNDACGYRAEDARTLVTFLGGWWEDHILRTDLQLKRGS